jgi:gas vesicle protein
MGKGAGKMSEEQGKMNDYTSRSANEYGTQTGNYGARAVERSVDYTRSDENKSSDEIKADIERKRNEMSQKINMIQDRLDPNRLKEQAQETVRSAVADSTDAVVQYFRDNVGDVSTNLIDTIKHNPIPAALIGIGVGWLLVESFRDSSSQSSSNYNQRYNNDNARYGSSARSQYGSRYDDYNYGYTSQGSQYRQGAQYGAGANYGARNVGSQYGTETAYTSGYVAYPESSEEQNQGRMSRTAQAAQDKVSDVAGQARDKASQLTGQVQDTAQQAASYVQDTAEQAASYVQDQVGQISDQASQWGSQAQQKVQQTLESNPVPFGVAALIAGALLGLALPETRAENQIMGETRDQLMDNAQNVARDVKDRVQNVVEEKLPEVKQTVQKAADDLTQTGKEAAQSLQQTGNQSGQDTKQAANNLKQDTKNAWQDTKQEAKNAWEETKQETKNAWQDAKQSVNNPSTSTAPEEEGSTKNSRS